MKIKFNHLLFFVCLFVSLQTKLFAVNAFSPIGDSTQTKQYLLQLYNHKLSKSDYKLNKEQFIDRYAYNKKAENLIHHYFTKREKKKIRNMNWGNFALENILFSALNLSWYGGAYQVLFVLFAALFVASVIAIALSILFLIFISVMLINLYKLINFSRRKLLVELIEMANNES
ncbi:MAG: hypothetical protein V4667_08100 [Bacteroidota bacterium]